jgi:hypothetical protein
MWYKQLTLLGYKYATIFLHNLCSWTYHYKVFLFPPVSFWHPFEISHVIVALRDYMTVGKGLFHSHTVFSSQVVLTWSTCNSLIKGIPVYSINWIIHFLCVFQITESVPRLSSFEQDQEETGTIYNHTESWQNQNELNWQKGTDRKTSIPVRVYDLSATLYHYILLPIMAVA